MCNIARCRQSIPYLGTCADKSKQIFITMLSDSVHFERNCFCSKCSHDLSLFPYSSVIWLLLTHPVKQIVNYILSHCHLVLVAIELIIINFLQRILFYKWNNFITSSYKYTHTYDHWLRVSSYFIHSEIISSSFLFFVMPNERARLKLLFGLMVSCLLLLDSLRCFLISSVYQFLREFVLRN